ncbi:MAG TPA: methyltransferase [Xanthobacteraceae bacterium]
MFAESNLGALTEDAVLGGALRLRQPRRGHRVGHDAVLLAAACPVQGGEEGHVVDLGAGVGAAGLAVALRAPAVAVTLVEVDPDLAALAAANAALNGLAARVKSITLDVLAPPRAFAAAGLAPESVAHVLMNPPFNDPVRQKSSPDRRRRLAHAAPREALAAWIRTAARLLRPRGTLTLIFRPEGLVDLTRALDPLFGAVAILPVYSKPEAPAIRILVRAIKASRAPLAVMPGLLLNDASGQPSAQAEAVLRGGASLPFPRI